MPHFLPREGIARRPNWVPDWARPLNPDIRRPVTLLLPISSLMYDVINGAQTSGSNRLAELTSTPDGAAMSTNGGTTTISFPARTEARNSITVMWVGTYESAGAGSGVLLRDNTITGGNIPLWVNGSTWDFRAGGADVTGAGSVTANQQYVAVYRAGATAGLYVDGRPIITGGTVGGTAISSPWHLMENGANTPSATIAKTNLVAVWDAPLTVEECLRLSASPEYLFEPEPIQIYWPSAGGGATSSFSGIFGVTASSSVVGRRSVSMTAVSGAAQASNASKSVSAGLSAIAGAVGSASGTKSASTGISAIAGLLGALETTTPGTSDFNAIAGALVSVTHSTARLSTIEARIGIRSDITGIRRAVSSLQAIAGAVASIEGSPDDNRVSGFAAIAGAAAALSKTTTRIADLAARAGVLGANTAATIRAAQLAAVAGLRAAIAGINVETAGKLLTATVSAQSAYDCTVTARAAYHCTINEAIVQ